MKKKSLFAAFTLFFGTAFLATPIAFANPAESEEPGEESGLEVDVDLGPVGLEVGIHSPSDSPGEEPPGEEPPGEEPPGEEPPGEEPPGEEHPGESPGEEPDDESEDESSQEPQDSSDRDSSGEQSPVEVPDLPESEVQKGSQLPKSGQSGGQSDADSESGEGGELPKTATSYPLMSLVGSLMMAAGLALLKLRPSRG